MEKTGARSVYELGCNAGWNLSAIKCVAPYASVYGHDINQMAVHQANTAGLDLVSHRSDFCYDTPTYDLVLTAGVLIHVSPENLTSTMRSLIDCSCDYVLSIEYDADYEQNMEYRGNQDSIWKRPYGKLYQGLGLSLVEHSNAGEGFDDCMYWLLKKP
jgi:trans-aconitate methyltransferase